MTNFAPLMMTADPFYPLNPKTARGLPTTDGNVGWNDFLDILVQFEWTICGLTNTIRNKPIYLLCLGGGVKMWPFFPCTLQAVPASANASMFGYFHLAAVIMAPCFEVVAPCVAKRLEGGQWLNANCQSWWNEGYFGSVMSVHSSAV